MRTFLFLIGATVATAIFSLTLAQTPGGSIAGQWEGESKCVDTIHYPACSDEHVRYEISEIPSLRDLVHLKASKRVNGKFVPMGDFDFQYARLLDRLTVDFKSPRFNGRWDLTVKGNTISGRLVDLSTNRTVRRVRATWRRKA